MDLRAGWFAAAGLVFASCSLGCTDVRIAPTGGSNDGGAPSLPFGGSALGGAPVGGDGGGEPGPVPDCETLVWAGEPLLIPGYAMREVVLARLADGAAGVVYVDGTQGLAEDRLTSRVVHGAFDAWPLAAVDEAVVHRTDDLVFGSSSISAREDGTFALIDYDPGIYRFGVPGVLLGSYPPYTYPFVEPAGDGAYFIERPLEGLRFYRRASIEPLAAQEDLGEVPLPDFCSTAYAELSGTPTFMFASRDYCSDGGGDPWAQFYQPGPTQMQVASVLPLPFFPRNQALAARAGGLWYAISSEETTRVYRLTPNTQPIGEPFVYEGGTIDARSFAPWRDGFVLSGRTADGVNLFVSNGEQITTAPVGEPNPILGMEATRMLVGGVDDESILIAVPSFDRIAIWRADCVAD